MIRKFLPVLLTLAFSTITCGFNISVPIHSVTPGPMATDQIHVPVPANTASPVDLSLAFGAGTLKIHLGANGMLVSGTAAYNIADFKPVIHVDGASVRIEQDNWLQTGIPDLSDIKNRWDLSLGNQPINLGIAAGAYHADYQFGGLALANLSVKDGASDPRVNFASPNLTGMSLLSYETGASNVSLTGLGNADFSSLLFHGGAGNFTLDFTGSLKRDGSVNIETGISNTTLVIPAGIPVQLSVEGALSNVTYTPGWSRNADLYTQAGSGPQLTIVVNMGTGKLTITR
ncbi:MAG: toast rack family protein [Anaerolineales bacterium]